MTRWTYGRYSLSHAIGYPKGAKIILREYLEDVGFVQPEDIEKIAKRNGIS